jgi:hypothetical protein
MIAVVNLMPKFVLSMYGQMKILIQFDFIVSNDTFPINLWAGISGYCITGPQTLPLRGLGRGYLKSIRKHLSGLLYDVFFNTHIHIWFQHDGAPPYCHREVRQWLSENYPGRWNGRGCCTPIFWPARSTDLNPLDSLL